MDERRLLRISFAFSIIGLVILVVLSSRTYVESIDINNIDGAREGVIKVYGKVSSIRPIGENKIIGITQPSSIEVLIGSKIDLSEGEIVEVIGRADEYNGKSQIVADRVRVVRSLEEE